MSQKSTNSPLFCACFPIPTSQKLYFYDVIIGVVYLSDNVSGVKETQPSNPSYFSQYLHRGLGLDEGHLCLDSFTPCYLLLPALLIIYLYRTLRA